MNYGRLTALLGPASPGAALLSHLRAEIFRSSHKSGNHAEFLKPCTRPVSAELADPPRVDAFYYAEVCLLSDNVMLLATRVTAVLMGRVERVPHTFLKCNSLE